MTIRRRCRSRNHRAHARLLPLPPLRRLHHPPAPRLQPKPRRPNLRRRRQNRQQQARRLGRMLSTPMRNCAASWPRAPRSARRSPQLARNRRPIRSRKSARRSKATGSIATPTTPSPHACAPMLRSTRALNRCATPAGAPALRPQQRRRRLRPRHPQRPRAATSRTAQQKTRPPDRRARSRFSAALRLRARRAARPAPPGGQP